MSNTKVEVAEVDLKRYKAERTQLRSVFTKACNALVELSKEKALSETKFEDTFAKVADKAERLFKIDQQVSDLLFIVVEDEEELSNDFLKTEKYREQWLDICSLRSKFSKVTDPDFRGSAQDNQSLASLSANKVHFKLPKFELPKFDGKIKNWIAFWAQYKKIHDDISMDEEDKFNYLLQSTKPGSPARELIDSYPPSAKNYKKAVEQLKLRFGNSDLLKRYYVRELLKLILSQNSPEKVNLRRLYDQLVTQLRSLESLEVTTEQYACFLFPLVESALPDAVLKEWERLRFSKWSVHQSSSDLDGPENSAEQLSDLLNFVKQEVECEERLALARTTFSNKVDHIEREHSKIQKRKQERIQKGSVPTATDLVNIKPVNKITCLICGGQHVVENCFKGAEMKPEEIRTTIKNKNGCGRCLRGGHQIHQCKVTLKCIICFGPHTPLLCPERKFKSVKEPEVIENNLANTYFQDVLLQTLVVRIKGKMEDQIRVLVDTGSQRSYLTKRVIRRMGYEPISQTRLVHALFGGAKTNAQLHECYQVRLCSMDRSYHCKFEALDTEVICQQVPVATKGPWIQDLHNRGIILSDQHEGPIDALIGADIAGKLMTGRKEELDLGLVALETLLGWTLMGRVKRSEENQVNIDLLTADIPADQLWNLDVLGIEDPTERKNREEIVLDAKRHFDETVRIQEDGRFEVKLPWLSEHPALPTNFELAKKRLDVNVRKLKETELLAEYEKTLQDWEREGIIEEVPFEKWDEGHYLPHRAVYKENSTTRVRPVFDASAKLKGHPSLNQCLTKGENLIELIPNILLRMRIGRLGVVADIKKAFLQISVSKEDRDFLRFLWKDDHGSIKIFRHRRVVFGVSSSPFLLGAVLEHHLSRCEKIAMEQPSPGRIEVIKRLRKSFYVDNCVTCLDDENELNHFKKEATRIFAEARFDLRGWEWSDPELSISEDTPLLGILWDKKSDVLKLAVTDGDTQTISNFTRRTLLSATQKIFDVIGVSSPTLLIPKLLIQKTWIQGGDWDTTVEEEVQVEFERWIKEIAFLREIELPRWLGFSSDSEEAALHVFCDASKVAYATVAFLRIIVHGEVKIHLLSAKSRVAPVKKITIPRLELMAATIGARLAHNLLNELGEIKLHCWSDSTTVIAWINREESWGVFVSNRAEEIRRLTNRSAWSHVPGSENPADLASRGCMPKNLVKSRWWEGPAWLRLPSQQWPSKNVLTNEEEVYEERKKSAVISHLSTCDRWTTDIFSRKFSDYQKIIRLAAWVMRFVSNCRCRGEKIQDKLSLSELNKAERYTLRLVQSESFAGVEDKQIKRLRPFLDSEGLIRLKTKIWARRDSENFRSPIILPNNHVIVERLVEQHHRRNGHMTGQNLMNELRENYWILRSRQLVRRITQRCVVCARFRNANFEAETPPLPESRVRDSRVFEVVGTDFAGPLVLSDGAKIWICIFTCAVYRAIHLELVSSLSVQGLVMALRRFIARRGRPSIIYSDNGTNFRGLNNALQKVDWDRICEYSQNLKIEWRFNPPTAAWWGGFWERLIGIVKVSLRKILGRASLNIEELTTVICECESYVNARPLTYVSEENDPVPITPQMFLQELDEVGVPDLDVIDSSKLYRRVKHRLEVRNQLRRRFRAEYLGQLLLKFSKKSRQPSVGEVVLLASDDKKKLDWPLAVVESLLPGRDGICRVVRLRTAEGRFSRPIQRVCPLEIFCTEDPAETDQDCNDSRRDGEPTSKPETEVVTRCGRVVKLPLRFQ